MRFHQTHRMQGRICHWVYCMRCGMVALKNDASRRVLARTCPDKEGA